MQPQPLMKLDIAPPLGQMRPQLRYPQPQEDTFHEHLGIIVEKTGEDNENSKKQRVMYLYSPTIRNASGRIVCSQYWRFCDLGQWIKFTVEKNEKFFSAEPIEAPTSTMLCPQNPTLPMVLVHFTLLPSFIRALEHNGKTKLYSRELGLIYAYNYQIARVGIRYGFEYTAWVRYSYTHVCFEPNDVNASGWPYEPYVYWELVDTDRRDIREMPIAEADIQTFEGRMYEMAVREQEREDAERHEERVNIQIFNRYREGFNGNGGGRGSFGSSVSFETNEIEVSSSKID
ncbi:hypothetical protein WR25_15432 [Diploscapter pachys]|uniref:Uncharacterized protein n=1 Tax=Diploscapter pachys TaxID=2018661 RepID=A0A2A2JFN2_9BILA|nr:hypothetical protein WR25_15432 [Diploscapter pachys]